MAEKVNLEEKMMTGELPLEEKTELGETFSNLDCDDVDKETGFSKIDFNTRLQGWEISNCMVFDELKALGILPQDANITTQKKRLAVSLGGEGRKEKVTIASANRDAELSGRSGGIMNKLGGLFKRRE